ncbi:MAG: dimethyl sulfoxide reductase anchor subunit [Candidatus Synoicihabitans palmerolidicus]|nr:dimethyl sulfoxide reductase anchor subunit [Candidatus Synoicihabitans palmerolidicus]
MIGGDEAHPFQQTITSACHHCADPGCLNGCPVLASEKDPVTGIVRHLDDQCIGCSYCILKCPYDVHKYNERLGIVRKCDMCHDRLAEEEAPACVQACPTQALKIVKVVLDLSGPTPRTDTTHFLPVAHDPATTQPTNRYITQRDLPTNLRPADAASPQPQSAHRPLIILLTTTQTALGFSIATPFSTPLLGYVALALALVGIAASVAHLGRPLRAWRIFLGLRRSWLSREALLLGAWFPLLAGAVIQPNFIPFVHILPFAAAITGLMAVFCSGMIYIDTPRHFWRPSATFIRMGGTVLVAALLPVAPLAAVVVLTAKLGFEHSQQRTTTPSAQILRTHLAPTHRLRILLGTCALGAFVTYYVTNFTVALAAAAALWFAGEIAERYLYFRAVDSAKMPGINAA